MFAQTESEELLHLLSQVRLVADEEERTDHPEEGLDMRDSNTTPPPPPRPALSTMGDANANTSKGGQRVPSAGRYTASSTAAADVKWTVHGNSRQALPSAADTQPHLGDAAIGRTPATGVKVLTTRDEGGDAVERLPGGLQTYGGDGVEDMMHHSLDGYGGDSYDALREPKQLFFVDAARQNARRSANHNDSIGVQKRQQNTNSAPSHSEGSPRMYGGLSPSASFRRWDIHAASSQTSASLMSPPSPPSQAGINAMAAVGEKRMSGGNGSATVMSALLSGYSQSLSQNDGTAEEPHSGLDRNINVEEGGEAQMDGLSRIAAELERAADEEEHERRSGRTGAAAGVWTPARSVGTPLLALTGSPQSLPPQQQPPSQVASPLMGGGPARPHPSGHGSAFSANLSNSTPSHLGAPPPPGGSAGGVPSRQLTTNHSSASLGSPRVTPTSTAEAAVANFFRASSAAPESSGVAAPPPAAARPFGEGLEKEAAWRLSVETELHELQRAGSATGLTSNSNGQRYGTPTTTISPLPPNATTPYHQLLSQLRYSPQQGAVGPTPGATAAAAQASLGARANTPPDRRIFAGGSPPSQEQQTVAGGLRSAADAAGGHTATAMATAGGGGGSGAAGRTTMPLYTAQVTTMDRPRSTTSASTVNTAATSTTTPSAYALPAAWPRSSPTHADPTLTAAMWERMSPYEKAAAIAASTSTGSGGTGSHVGSFSASGVPIFHTPDTVAKPVTLSSIAAHLHRPDMLGTPDDPPYAVRAAPASPQQQQPQRYTSPSNFTTAATGAGDHAGKYHDTSSQRLSDFDALSGPSIPLFPSLQQPQQPRTPAGPGAGAASNVPWRQQYTPQQQQPQPYSHTAPARPLQRSSGGGAGAGLSAYGQGTPVEAPSNASNNSPPSCSLRPSPHMRASDGSSPTLRRYIITTPNTRTTTTAAGSNNNINSAGKKSAGGSPLGGVVSAGGGNGSAREARPRVQLSQPTSAAVAARALKSPLNAGVYSHSPAGLLGHHHNPNGSPFTPPYHHHLGSGTPSAHAMRANSPSLGFASSVSGGSVAGGGSAAALVSPAAVRVLIERLQAAAPALLGSPRGEPEKELPPTATTTAAERAEHPATAASYPSNAYNNNNNSSSSSNNTLSFNSAGGAGMSGPAIPDVASAQVILAMSHDQHGCRLLQAVLDAECGEGEVLPNDSGEAAMAPSQHHNSAVDPATLALERRRRRRAEAFYRSTAVQVILRAIEPKLDAVMADGYGNFLLQKVFDMAPDAERQRLLRLPSLQHHLCEVACSPHGTFAVQRLVETVRNAEEERLVFVALERDLLRLLTNANGGHVLMKVMECIRRQYSQLTSSAMSMAANVEATHTNGPSFSSSQSSSTAAASAVAPPRRLLQERVDALFLAIQQHLLYVCQHKQGCCIVQKCLDFLNACSGLSPVTATAAATENANHDNEKDITESAPPQQQQQQQQDYFERMSALLLPHVQELSVHPYGNYVVTRLVDVCYARGSTATIDGVATVMQRDFVRMCTNKFASNVVEHILRHCSERRIRSICQTLMTKADVTSTKTSSYLMSTSAAAMASAAHPSLARLPLTTVVMDSYGNYVIQTLLTVAPVDELASPTAEEGGMLPVLQQLLPLLSSCNFGRKLETKTELAVLRVEQQQQQQQHRRI